MRQNGVHMVTATCANCGRSADVNVDLLPETLTVPEAGQRLRCSSCGGENEILQRRLAAAETRAAQAALTKRLDTLAAERAGPRRSWLRYWFGWKAGS
jgi:hypothetical protein